MFNIVVFISGTGSNLGSIIAKQQQYGYQVNLVISNKKQAKGLDYARQNNIPQYTFDWDKNDTELQHLQDVILKHNCQLLVLAGFMKILPEPFLNSFNNKIINIHPSLLPKYPGLHTHQRVIDNKDDIHGATVHFVNAQLDGGKIISQSTINVAQIKDANSLAKKVLFIEHSLLPRTIALIAQNRVKWHKENLFYEQIPLTQPLTQLITQPIIIND